MNTKHLVKVLEEARAWTNSEYEEKGGIPETDRYHIQKQIARLELLHFIADTYIEKRENGKL
jgi:predicted transcriptional regulator